MWREMGRRFWPSMFVWCFSVLCKTCGQEKLFPQEKIDLTHPARRRRPVAVRTRMAIGQRQLSSCDHFYEYAQGCELVAFTITVKA